jgi:hypothetical protein
MAETKLLLAMGILPSCQLVAFTPSAGKFMREVIRHQKSEERTVGEEGDAWRRHTREHGSSARPLEVQLTTRGAATGILEVMPSLGLVEDVAAGWEQVVEACERSQPDAGPTLRARDRIAIQHAVLQLSHQAFRRIGTQRVFPDCPSAVHVLPLENSFALNKPSVALATLRVLHRNKQEERQKQLQLQQQRGLEDRLHADEESPALKDGGPLQPYMNFLEVQGLRAIILDRLYESMQLLRAYHGQAARVQLPEVPRVLIDINAMSRHQFGSSSHGEMGVLAAVECGKYLAKSGLKLLQDSTSLILNEQNIIGAPLPHPTLLTRLQSFVQGC